MFFIFLVSYLLHCILFGCVCFFQCIKALVYQSHPGCLDINAANDSGDTALHQAAKWSYGVSLFILKLAFNYHVALN